MIEYGCNAQIKFQAYQQIKSLGYLSSGVCVCGSIIALFFLLEVINIKHVAIQHTLLVLLQARQSY